MTWQTSADALYTKAITTIRASRTDSKTLAALSPLELRACALTAQLSRRASRDKDLDQIGPQALHLLIRFGDYNIGAHRVVFPDKNVVYKLAFGSEGDLVNDIEVRGAIPAPVARCSWAQIDGIQVIEMERVDVVDARKLSDDELREAPWWADVDQWVIGKTPAGRFVVFDAGQFGRFNRDLLSAAQFERYRRVSTTHGDDGTINQPN